MPGQVANHMIGIEGFYRFTHNAREQAPAARWRPPPAAARARHTRFWRYGEKPARHHRLDERQLLTDAAFAQIVAALDALGDPVGEGGLGASGRCAR